MRMYGRPLYLSAPLYLRTLWLYTNAVIIIIIFFGPTSTKPQAEILKLNISYYISLGVLSFFSSNALLGGHHTEHNQTLPHVLK